MEDHPKIQYFTLDTAAKKYFPDGTITSLSLRREANKGNLSLVKIAGKYLVSEKEILEMLEKSKCLPQESPQGSTCAKEKIQKQNTSSLMEREKQAQDAINANLKKLNNH